MIQGSRTVSRRLLNSATIGQKTERWCSPLVSIVGRHSQTRTVSIRSCNSTCLERKTTLLSNGSASRYMKAMSTGSPAKTLPEAFRRATLYTDGRIYKLLRFPRSSMEFAMEIWTKSNTLSSPSSSTCPFGAFLVDKDEITFMVDNEVYSVVKGGKDCRNEDENRSVIDNGISYRLFTFDDVVMDPSLVGFMAVITKVLAENDISVLPYAAYSTDHIFVADFDADKTKKILEGLMK